MTSTNNIKNASSPLHFDHSNPFIMICTDDFKELKLSKWDKGQQDAATSDVDNIAPFLAIDLAKPNGWHRFGEDSGKLHNIVLNAPR
ncbi:unnamed protein product [Tilletia controversa]|nr:unnamed protein product [Tilletia controversa]CAD6929600.1 unnamed protein product [Tilletia controversa]